MIESAVYDVSTAQEAQPPVRLPSSKPKRLPRQSCTTPPPGAKPDVPGQPLGFSVSVVPVSAVAKQWNISARRVRLMLEQGRLDGRQLENGYWQVYYPYRYVFGTRGPAIKWLQQLQALPAKPKKQDQMKEW